MRNNTLKRTTVSDDFANTQFSFIEIIIKNTI